MADEEDVGRQEIIYIINVAFTLLPYPGKQHAILNPTTHYREPVSTKRRRRIGGRKVHKKGWVERQEINMEGDN